MKKSKSKSQRERRKRGTGGAFQRGNTWYGRIRKGGELILTEGYESEDDALSALDRLLNSEIDPRVLPDLQTYWGFLLRQDGVFEHRYDAQTCNLYETVLTRHFHGAALGKERLDQISGIKCQRHIDRLYKNLASSTVRRYGSCLHTVLEEAVKEKLIFARIERGQIIPANPADEVKYRELGEVDFYIFDEQELADYPKLLFDWNPKISAVVTVLADSGARPGEVCAMDDTKVVKGVWTIDDTRRKKGGLKGETKNGIVRCILLSDDAQAAIARYGQKKGPTWLNAKGRPMTPGNLSHYMRDFRAYLQAKWNAKAEEDGVEARIVPPLTPRNLRKTFVTRAVDQAGAKNAQQAAGHKKAETTLNIYAKAKQRDSNADLIQGLQKGIKRTIFSDKATIKATENERASQKTA